MAQRFLLPLHLKIMFSSIFSYTQVSNLLSLSFSLPTLSEFQIFIYLFMATLGLRCCTWAFSSCGEWELLFVAVRGLSSCGARA